MSLSDTRLARALALVLALSPACGDDDDAGQSDDPATAGRDASVDWAAQFDKDPHAALTAALSQSHEAARDRLGGHKVHWVFEIDLGPVSASEDDPDPPVDRPVVIAQHVSDELTLRWTGTTTAVGFALKQHNDAGRGRDVIVAEERVYVRHPPGPWVAYPLESPLWQGWLDDAWLAPRDAVGFCAPAAALSVRTVPGAGHDGGDAIEVTLSRADTVDDSRRPQGPTQQWREDATFAGIAGTVRLDAASGLWLHADIDVSYAVPGADGTPKKGHLHLTGDVSADPGPAARAPADAEPLPQRPRYDAQARMLLEGLAAPPP